MIQAVFYLNFGPVENYIKIQERADLDKLKEKSRRGMNLFSNTSVEDISRTAIDYTARLEARFRTGRGASSARRGSIFGHHKISSNNPLAPIRTRINVESLKNVEKVIKVQ